jgi:hypothetical protein
MEGDYVLARLDTGAVPGILARQKPCLIVLAAGSMHIMKGDSFNSHFTIMRHCADSIAQVPDPGTRGPFSTNADTIYFGTADGRSGGAGVFKGDTIRVQGPQHSLVYIRKKKP